MGVVVVVGLVAVASLMTLIVSLSMALFPDNEEERLKWRWRAAISGVLSAGSVALLALFIYALSHLG